MSRAVVFIIFLTAFSLFIRLYRVNEPNHYYFDEVYHVVTSRAIAQNNPDAYNPFSPPPEKNTAYDWLHPPLAKLIQAGSIKIIGDNPVGWRLPSVIFGAAIIPAVFILAYLLFNYKIAVFSSIILASENLNLVMSRITMNDVFVTFFAVVSLIFVHLFVKNNKLKYLVLASIFLGFSVSSKWTGVFAIIVSLLYIVIYSKDKLHVRNLLILFIPVIIYLSSYGQFWLQGHSIRDFVNLHKQIFVYQKRSDLEHPYGTTPLYCVANGLNGDRVWCPWIFDIRSVYFSYEQYGEKAGYIYALGNPAVYWLGVIGAIFIFWRFLVETKREYFLILIAYLIFWVPWIFSPRIMFMYHYLPSIPFLSIGLAILLYEIYKSQFKSLAIFLLLIIVGLFFFFYPVSSGYPIDTSSIERYMWLNTWR